MQNMKEREISLIDLCVDILLRWRIIVVVMVIGGVLMGAFGYIKSVQAVKAQQAQAEAKEQQLAEQKEQQAQMTEEDLAEWHSMRKQELEETLTATQIANVNSTIMYKELVAERQAYLQESVLMQADPINLPKAELTFLIKSDDMERTYNIEKVYEDLIVSADLFNYVKENCGIENEVNELIELEQTSYNQLQGSDAMRVSVCHSDETVCQAMAEAIVEYAKQQQKQLNGVVGKHELVLISQSFGTVIDEALLTEQKNCKTDIINWQNAAAKLKTAFTEEEAQYYDLLVRETASEDKDADAVQNAENAQTDTIASPGISMKYVLLGMILFAFVYVFVVFLMYIMNNKLRSTDNLQDVYGIPQLGAVSALQKKKKFLGIIDRWILKLRYRNQRRFNAEEATNLATVATKMAVKKQGLNKLCMLGCNLTGEALSICEKVKECLSAEGVSVQILSNVLYDAEVMEELADVQGAVLVETVGSTLYDEIVKELELLNRQNIEVLGGIVVE